MKNIKCTEEQINTIYTAVRLEYLRNYGKDPKVEKILKEAMEVIRNAK